MIRIESIGENNIAYTTNPSIHVMEYYNYCLNLLKKKLSESNKPINIIFGNINHNFNNGNLTIKTDIQYEHTLVKDGGRGVNEKIFGNVKHDNGFYLVRIDNYNYLSKLDFILEYSIPNIINITESNHFDDYSKKIINIAPLLYDIDFDKTNKVDTITLFTDTKNVRRNKLLNENNWINVDDCYTNNDLITRYKKTKILVNVHQTDHHHTFEELRILPALSRGVVIVSEDVPLKEYIPYHEFIVWSSYNNLTKTVIEVQDNYEYYYNKLFKNSNLDLLLYKLSESNYNNLNIINTKLNDR